MRRPYHPTVVPELAETHGHHKTHRYRERPLTSERAGRPLPETCGPDVDQSLGGLRSSQAVRQSANSLRSREPDVSNQPSNHCLRRRRTPVDVSGPYVTAQHQDTKARATDIIP